ITDRLNNLLRVIQRGRSVELHCLLCFTWKISLSVFYRDSCPRGWRLLYILTAYYRCSEVLKPYLLRFLQDMSRSPGLHFQGNSLICHLFLISMLFLRLILSTLFHPRISTCSVGLHVISNYYYYLF
uniref:MyTH4 domain-containing protein n=1 Tax=Erpetoichthys calabaricus TaxID=27687 RepID=A0A8C4SJK3_ERPCA